MFQWIDLICFLKGIDSLPQTQMFLSLFLWYLMTETFYILNLWLFSIPKITAWNISFSQHWVIGIRKLEFVASTQFLYSSWLQIPAHVLIIYFLHNLTTNMNIKKVLCFSSVRSGVIKNNLLQKHFSWKPIISYDDPQIHAVYTDSLVRV